MFPELCQRRVAVQKAAGRSLALGLVALLLGGLLALATPSTASAGTTVRLTALEAAHLDKLNDWRQARGLSRLTVDPITQVHTRQWTHHMAATQTLAHDPGLRNDCMAASSNCSRWAENVGYSTGGHASVFRSFENSSGHRANMATANSQVDRVGIGVFTDGQGRTWVTQRFIKCSCNNDASGLNAERTRFEGWVAALYADFLGRNGTGSEVAAHVDRIVYDRNIPGTVGAFAGSNEWVSALIESYYQATLGRGADAQGMQNWLNTYRSGWTPARIASAFFASDEFYSRSGGTNRGWITELYRQILGRNPDSAGMQHWKDKADRGVSRLEIAMTFYQSVESRQTRVTDLYQSLLKRNPDGQGLRTWTDTLANGRDVHLAATLARSSEYMQKADARF